jgi:hypothetical protein
MLSAFVWRLTVLNAFEHSGELFRFDLALDMSQAQEHLSSTLR